MGIQNEEGRTLRLQRFSAAVVVCSSLAIGVAACGSSNDSSSTTDGASAQKGGTLNGAGATVPAPLSSAVRTARPA